MNVGGAVVPTVLSIYLMIRNRLYRKGLLGGAGTFDGIFLTGILAVLLA